DALDNERRRRRALRRETVGRLEAFERLLELRLVVVVNHHERLALFHLRADLLDFGNAGGVVDLALLVIVAAIEDRNALGDAGGVDSMNVATLWRGQFANVLRGRELVGMIDE